MTKFVSLLAQLDAFNPLGPMPPVSKTTGLVFRDMVLIGAAVLGLSLLLILWARRYVRRSKRHRHEHRSESPLVRHEESSSTRRHHRHRHPHRRRRHSHAERGSNPTLAETGGLPPIRPQSSPNPPA